MASSASNHQFRWYIGRKTVEQWAGIASKATRDKHLQGWLASVLWWSHPHMKSGDALDRIAARFNPHDRRDWSQLLRLLNKIGLPGGLQVEHTTRASMRPRNKQAPPSLGRVA